MHISIEGIDGVGKTTTSKIVAKKLGFHFIEKPLKYLFDTEDFSENNAQIRDIINLLINDDEDNINTKHYIRIRDMMNNQEDRFLSAWFYGLGNIFLKEMFKDKDIVTDRHLLSNYAWSGTENNKKIYDLIIDRIGLPNYTFILYAKKDSIIERLKNRAKQELNEVDSDYCKIDLSDELYRKMKDFCSMYNINYHLIDTSYLTAEETADKIIKYIQSSYLSIGHDMKYVSLYSALGFIEEEQYIYVKAYNNFSVYINVKEQFVDYGVSIKILDSDKLTLKHHKDFVILECVDRLLTNSISSNKIKVFSKGDTVDIIVENIGIHCKEWGDDYLDSCSNFELSKNYTYNVVYTSRLSSGLLEYKNTIYANGNKYIYGFFEKGSSLLNPKLLLKKHIKIELLENKEDYKIEEDRLIRYKGNNEYIKITNGISSIESSAFWDCNNLKEVVLPKTLIKLGGDAFYYCKYLKKLTISKNVSVIGDNPFAGCEDLIIENDSPHFILENGVLYNKDKTILIHYTPSNINKEFVIPDGIAVLGKHCFYNCKNLEKITISSSVALFKNNPFSGCSNLKEIENNSKYYHFYNGLILNRFRTIVISCLNNIEMDVLVFPESVTTIARNSFYNCKGIKKIILSENINNISYNPFAGCPDLILESNTKHFPVKDDILYKGSDFSYVQRGSIYSNVNLIDTVKVIGRGAFSGHENLERIDFSNVTNIQKSSFSNCKNLLDIKLSDTLKYIETWAFAYCDKLKSASINRHTTIEDNAFNYSPTKIIMED